MANEQNLRPPVKPGEILNPHGRPKGSRNLSTLLKEIIELKNTDGKTYGEILMAKLYEKGFKGSERAIEIIMDRLEGKPLQKQEIKHEGLITHADIFGEINNDKETTNQTNEPIQEKEITEAGNDAQPGT